MFVSSHLLEHALREGQNVLGEQSVHGCSLQSHSPENKCSNTHQHSSIIISVNVCMCACASYLKCKSNEVVLTLLRTHSTALLVHLHLKLSQADKYIIGYLIIHFTILFYYL